MRRRDLICGLGVFSTSACLEEWVPLAGSRQKSYAFDAPDSGALPSPIGGIRIVDSDMARMATQLARSASPPYLFNHAVRTFLFGSLTGRALGQKFDDEVLYLACILHDLGLTKHFEGDLPFEIQGAQAARQFLEEHRYDQQKAATVWDGIAMHTSQIGQFKQPEVALVGAGAGADVLGPDFSQIQKSDTHEILMAYPRLGFRNAFVETCADVVRNHPNAAAHSFMRDIGERYVLGYHVRNFCDLIAKAPFSD